MPDKNRKYRRAVIICHGSMDTLPVQVGEEDMIICADGGAEHAFRFDLMPHVVMGDLDSVAPEVLDHWRRLNVPVQVFPVRKDQTDSEIAVRMALGEGVDEIVLLGVLGGRWDHSLANILLLEQVSQAGRLGCVAATDTRAWVLTGGYPRLTLEGQVGDTVSLLPLSERVTGVTLKGFDYPLDNAILFSSETLGVSNKLIEPTGEISIEGGRLVVMRTLTGNREEK